jgi:uncharacterized protein YlxW (UPF0749 family)
MENSTWIAIISSLGVFAAAGVAALVQWRGSANDDMSKFRADLFKMNDSLRNEITDLRSRVGALEHDIHDKTREILDLTHRIAKIRIAVLSKFSVDIDDLMEDRDDDAPSKH